MIDIHALSGAYAVDAVDDAERVLFEKHLEECPACRAEVDSLREASALLAEMTAVSPPPALRDRVLADITRVRPLPPTTPPSAPSSEPSGSTVVQEVPTIATRQRRWFPALAAAAAVITVFGVGAAVTQPWQDDSSQIVATADQILAASDAHEVRQEFPDGATATVVHAPSIGGAMIQTTDMPPAPEDMFYVLWLQAPDGDMVPAGAMPPAPDQTVVFDADASEALAAAITVESDAEVDEPTSDPIAVFDLTESA